MFEEIKTQEALDEIIKGVEERKEVELKEKYKGYLSPDEVTKKYEGYLSPDEVTKKYEGYVSAEDAAKTKQELDSLKIAALKTKVAMTNGLPYEFAERLVGSDEEEIQKDANRMAQFVKAGSTAPLASKERETDAKREQMKTMLSKLRGE